MDPEDRLQWMDSGLAVFRLKGGPAAALLWETLALGQPFLCVLLLVPRGSVRKGMAAALGCCLIDLPKYLILLFFFQYSSDQLDTPAAFLVELLLNTVFCCCFCCRM